MGLREEHLRIPEVVVLHENQTPPFPQESHVMLNKNISENCIVITFLNFRRSRIILLYKTTYNSELKFGIQDNVQHIL